MCGYCTEIIGIENVVQEEIAGKEVFFESDEDWVTRSFLAMESLDLYGCFEKLGNLDQEGLDIILYCRIIEALVEHGVDSELYQRLIGHQVAQDALKIIHARQVYFDTRLFRDGSSLIDLLSPEFLQSNKKVELCFGDISALAADCADFLRRYVEWWCLGSGLRGQEIKVTWFVPDSDEDESDSGQEGDFQFNIESEEEEFFQFDMELAEKKLFHSVLPYVIFSLAVSRKYRVNQKEVFSLVTGQPKGAIDMIALDLWLQRRAIVTSYDLSGVDQIISYNASIRSILLYYLALTKSLPKGEVRRLGEAMVIKEPLDDNYHWVKEWFLSN